MLKNEKLVHRLTLLEKISLIVSFDKYKTGEVKNYNFPVFDLLENPINSNPKAKCTNFPTLKGLSQTFNDSLIEGISHATSIEKNIFSENPFFVFDNSLNPYTRSDDAYLNGRLLSSYFKGIKNSYSSLVYVRDELSKDESINKEIQSLMDYYILKDNLTDYLVVDRLSLIDEAKYLYKGSNHYLSKTDSLTELVKFINYGIYQNFCLVNEEEAMDYLVKANKRFELFYQRYKNKVISEEEYMKEYLTGSLLDTFKVDEDVDNYISLLLSLEKDRKKSIAENSFMVDGTTYSFDATKHNELAYSAAAESIVLLKNDNNVLPLRLNKKIAVVGDAFKNPDYLEYEFSHKSLIYKTPFELIKDYLELDCLGFAHGYLKEKEVEFELLENAKKLLDKADVLLYYMESNPLTHEIPEAQIEVLRELKQYKDIKTIVVLNTNFYTELSFLDLCDSLILSLGAGEQGPKAVLDIISGSLNPNGRLTSSYPLLPSEDYEMDPFPSYSNKDYPVSFPFGYGLSYSTFDYSHFELRETGITFTIRNTSDVDGYDVPQVYIKRIGSEHSLKQMLLKGYKKVFVKAKEAVKVTIEFDESAFRYFDTKSQSFGIEGGEYRVYVGKNSMDLVYKGTLTLAKFLNKGFLNSNKEVLSTGETLHGLEEFNDKLKNYHPSRKHFISTIIFSYFVILLGVVFIGYFYPRYSGDDFPYILATSLSCFLVLCLFILFFVLYNVKVSKKKKALFKEYEDSNLQLSEMIDVVPDFVVTNKKEYTVYSKKELKDIEEEKEEPLTNFEKTVEEIVVEETKKEEEIKAKEENVEPVYQEIDLEVEKEEKTEEVINLDEAALSLEEIQKHEQEERDRINQIEDNLFSEETEEVITYDNNQSISQVADKLIEYAKLNGLILEVTSSRSIISAIASSNIIFLYSKQNELLVKLSEIVTKFFQSKGHVFKELDHFTTPFDLCWEKDVDGNYQKTQFVNDIYNASLYKDSINIETLTNVTMSRFNEYFKDFISFSESPTKSHFLKINDKQSLKIPTNITFLVIPKEDNFISLMDSKLSYVSESLNITVREAEIGEVIVDKVDPISYPYFKELILEAKKDFYIKEANWKKFDELESTLKKEEPFKIDNKLMLQLENYSSIYLDLGGEEIDAIDSILSEKFIPIIKSLKLAKKVGSTKTIIELLEKIFSEEYVTKTKKILKEIEQIENETLQTISDENNNLEEDKHE